MAVDMFMKLDGIDGESKDSAHAGEIDVLAWSWGLMSSGTSDLGGGGGQGKVNVQDLSFTHRHDKASPNLMLYCCDSKPIPEALLTIRKPGGEKLEFLKITMTDVIITSVNSGGSNGENDMTENVTLDFAKVKQEYTEQNPDGSGGAAVEACWNIEQNIPE